jgi:5-methylcytosine-specific restriction endonuclease McrA
MSTKRRNEAGLRAQVRQEVLERDGSCVGPQRGLRGICGNVGYRTGLEVHEVAARSTTPGSHLRVDLAVALCPRHHDMVTSPFGEDRERAIKAGLLVRSWEVDQ